MRAKIISVGNSKGLRLPKAIIDRYRFEGDVELVQMDEGLLIRPLQQARAGWDEAFSRMHTEGDDAPLIDDALDLEDWGTDTPNRQAR